MSEQHLKLKQDTEDLHPAQLIIYQLNCHWMQQNLGQRYSDSVPQNTAVPRVIFRVSGRGVSGLYNETRENNFGNL
jgi:hypothetical protein